MPASRLQEQFHPFDGKLVSSRGAILNERDFRKLDNCITSLTREGTIEVTPGFRAVSDLGELGLAFAYTRAQDGSSILIVATADKLLSVSLEDATLGDVTTIKAGLTTTQTSFTTFEDLLLFFNGVDPPQRVSIEAVPVADDIGVETPDVTLMTTVLSPGGDNQVRKVVRYWIAKMDQPTVEGATSLSFGEINAADGNRVLVNFPEDAEFNGFTFRIYRSEADGFTKNYLAEVDVPASGGLVYVDDTPDDELGSLPEANGDQPPPEITSAVNHFERVFGMAGSVVYWSDLGLAESWWVSESIGNFLEVFGSDGDTGTVLARDIDGVLLFKRNHLYKLLGRIPEDFVVTEITLSDQDGKNIGTPTNKSLVAIPGGVVFYWNRSVYLYRSGAISYISGDIRGDLEVPLLERNEDKVELGYDPVRRHVLVSLPLAGEENTHTYIYSADRRAFIGRMTVGFRDFTVIENEFGNLELWAVSNTTNELYRMLDGYNYNGVDIQVDMERYPFKPGPGFSRFQFGDILFDPAPGQALRTEFSIDGFPPVPAEFDMEGFGSQEAHKRSVNLGFTGRHVSLRSTATVNNGVLDLTGNGLQVTGNGLDIDGRTGQGSLFRLNGINYGWQSLERVSR